MIEPRRVLVATQDPGMAHCLVAWLSTAGLDLTLVTTFQAAKRQLAMKPSLVIADVKLGAYNGLQVAARAGALGIASIVIGPPDTVLVRDAMDLGATYLATDLAESPLLATILSLMGVEDEATAPACATDGRSDVAAEDDHEWPLWREPEATVRTTGSPKRSVVH